MPRTKEKESVKNAQAQASREEMEVAAYYHWLGRGCPDNDALTDWLEVERQSGNGGSSSGFQNN